MIILKNKNNTIEIEGNDNIYTSANITTNTNTSDFLADKDGKFEKGGKEIPLKDYIEEEKRNFYKNLLQSQYSEIENIIILSGVLQ